MKIAKSEASQEALKTTISSLTSTMNLIASTTQQMGRIDSAFQSQASTAATISASIASSGEKLTDVSASLSTTIAANQRDIVNLQMTIEQLVRDEMAKVMDTVNTAIAASSKKVDDSVKASADKVNKAHSDITASAGAAKCVEKNQLFDSAAKTCRTAVWTRHFNNEDSRENGWLSNRRLSFTKWFDDTMLVIDYHDNMRVHGHHWCRANWRVHIDRSECNDPGVIRFTKYNHQQHNYWMNFHVGGSAHGVCRRTGRGVIKKGSHTIEVYVGTDRCDTHTGHHGQGGYITVRETLVEKRTS